jgi:alpha-L-fucosidase
MRLPDDSYGLKVGIYKTLINWRYPGYYDVTGTDCKPNKFGYTTDIAHKENARLMKEEITMYRLPAWTF